MGGRSPASRDGSHCEQIEHRHGCGAAPKRPSLHGKSSGCRAASEHQDSRRHIAEPRTCRLTTFAVGAPEHCVSIDSSPCRIALFLKDSKRLPLRKDPNAWPGVWR